MKTSRPKIVYNEEYIDLRENFQSTMKKDVNPKQLSAARKSIFQQNETVNTALKKLARTYNSNVNPNEYKLKIRDREYTFNNPCRKRFSGPQDGNSLKSKSELVSPLKKDSNNKVTYPSSPLIQSTYDNGDFLEKFEPFQNKFTMTKVKEVKAEDVPKGGKRLIRDKSLEQLIDKLVSEKPSVIATEICHHPVWKDRRLIEKYSVLKVPWKRSKTVPVYLTRPSVTTKHEYYQRLKGCSDKKTYFYDDGSDVDSLIYNQRNSAIKYFGYAFQSQLLALLNISAYLCAILVLSLIVWFVSGNKTFYKLIPQPPEDPIKKRIKYVGGAVIYYVSSVVRFIGRIFAIPTQQVFHPAADAPWPP